VSVVEARTDRVTAMANAAALAAARGCEPDRSALCLRPSALSLVPRMLKNGARLTCATVAAPELSTSIAATSA
jgi:hypothetical protein